MGSTYNVKLADEKSFEIEIDGEQLKLNQQVVDLDIVSTGKDEWSIIKDNTSYLVKLYAFNPAAKKVSLSVNQEIFELDIEDELVQLLNRMGINQGNATKVDKVIAPMPGMVLKVLTEVGKTIEKGDSLLILEAMKMENIIKATGHGVVKSILVKNQDAVEKNQILIEME